MLNQAPTGHAPISKFSRVPQNVHEGNIWLGDGQDLTATPNYLLAGTSTLNAYPGTASLEIFSGQLQMQKFARTYSAGADNTNTFKNTHTKPPPFNLGKRASCNDLGILSAQTTGNPSRPRTFTSDIILERPHSALALRTSATLEDNKVTARTQDNWDDDSHLAGLIQHKKRPESLNGSKIQTLNLPPPSSDLSGKQLGARVDRLRHQSSFGQTEIRPWRRTAHSLEPAKDIVPLNVRNAEPVRDQTPIDTADTESLNYQPTIHTANAQSLKRLSVVSKAITTKIIKNKPTSSENVPSPILESNQVTSETETIDGQQLSPTTEKVPTLRRRDSKLRNALSFANISDFKKAIDFGDAARLKSRGSQKTTPADGISGISQVRTGDQQSQSRPSHGIYLARRFTRSADNLSIASTSSASIIMHKMGRGVKKSTRSLVGLFRPKSVASAPDGFSMSKFDPNAEPVKILLPLELPPLGPGVEEEIPKRADRSSDENIEQPWAEIRDFGGEEKVVEIPPREVTPEEITLKEITLEEITPEETTPKETTPKEITPKDVPLQVHSPTFSLFPRARSSSPSLRSVKMERRQSSRLSGVPSPLSKEIQDNEMASESKSLKVPARALRDSKSVPNIRNGRVKRTTTFSPSLCFYTTWSSQDYDRSSGIDTYMRLTPMTVQQIKEEVNCFKMEMDVHEKSKIYTHFY